MRYFLVAILDNNKDFGFLEKMESNVVLENLLEEHVDEKYYLTNSNYIEKDNKRIFKHKDRDDIEYEVDMDKYFKRTIITIKMPTAFFFYFK